MQKTLKKEGSIMETSNNIAKKIYEKLFVIISQPLIDIGRASNLVWISFGEKIVFIDRKGNKSLKGKYSINIQCSWRITQDSKIIVASKDIYIPKTNFENDEFNWEIYGENRFDEKINEIKSMIDTSKIFVTNVSSDELGGIIITFNSGLKLELFPDGSIKDEYWRFIIFGDINDHFIIFDED